MKTEIFAGMSAMVEIMGHKRIFGMVFEEEHCGTTMLRVDTDKGTQYFTADAIFSITPISKDLIRESIQESTPAISEWDFQHLIMFRDKYRELVQENKAFRAEYPDFIKESPLTDDLPF